MFAEIFIKRPKFAFVISIVTVLVGTICLFRLPIAEYPEIAPPTVKVTAMYPGATSQVIAETVASVIEEQINGIEDLLYFKSESDNNGNYTLTLTFRPGNWMGSMPWASSARVSSSKQSGSVSLKMRVASMARGLSM